MNTIVIQGLSNLMIILEDLLSDIISQLGELFCLVTSTTKEGLLLFLSFTAILWCGISKHNMWAI